MRLLLQRWQEISLKLHDKVTVMKSLILPIAFSVLNCETPMWTSKTKNARLYGFLCGSSEKTVIGSFEEVNLGMIDTENNFNALKVSWVKRICEADTASTWTYIPIQYTRNLNIL